MRPRGPVDEQVPPPVALLFDAGATLVQPHVGRLAEALAVRGHVVGAAELDAAVWRAIVRIDTHHGPGSGPVSGWLPTLLTWLGAQIGVPGPDVLAAWQDADAQSHLWDQPVEGVAAALDRLAALPVRLGVVSNADGRVADALARAGLADRFEVIVDSSVVGVAKPDPGIFRHALAPMGLRAGPSVWYLGDTVGYDVAAAVAAGLTAFVIDHRGLHDHHQHPRTVRSLDEYVDVVAAAIDPGPDTGIGTGIGAGGAG